MKAVAILAVLGAGIACPLWCIQIQVAVRQPYRRAGLRLVAHSSAVGALTARV